MAVSTRTNGTAIVSSSSDSQEQVIRLPAGFLLTPRDAVKKDINWHETSIPEYKGYYSAILDDAFTPTECKILLKLAELTTKGKWEQAMVNVGYGEQALMTETRDCGRILWDDRDMAERIWNRVKDHVPEILYLRGVPHITGQGPAKRKEIWRATGVNERMRFLKYGPGQYFRGKALSHFSCSNKQTCILTKPPQHTKTAATRTLILRSALISRFTFT